jgi:hypothetical protein
MICSQCSKENADHIMFCMGCGGRLARVAPEPGNPARRCAGCGGVRTLQGAVGPAMGVRVYAGGRPVDLPLAWAVVCADCGHVALAIADDARRYLAGTVG